MITIHDIIEAKVDLAKIYAEDGAFHSAARVLTELADIVKGHALACDALLGADLADHFKDETK